MEWIFACRCALKYFPVSLRFVQSAVWSADKTVVSAHHASADFIALLGKLDEGSRYCSEGPCNTVAQAWREDRYSWYVIPQNTLTERSGPNYTLSEDTNVLKTFERIRLDYKTVKRSVGAHHGFCINQGEDFQINRDGEGEAHQGAAASFYPPLLRRTLPCRIP